MKKILFIMFALALCLCLGLACFAEGNEAQGGSSATPTTETSNIDIKAYIQEKIVPIVVGVATSIVALITTLYKIGASLKALSGTRETLDADAKKREAAVASLGEQVEQIKASIKDVPSLEKSIEELSALCSTIAEILSLGFSANEEIIKSGKGKKMSALLQNAKINPSVTQVCHLPLTKEAAPHPSPVATPSPQGEGKGE